MTTISRAIIDGERGARHAVVEPRDAATLVIVDGTGAEPKVLLGRRHARHVFMPGKFVFPGGRVDAADRLMPAARPMPAELTRRLLTATPYTSEADARSFALAAIRETFEETGMVIGAPAAAGVDVPAGAWIKFAATGFHPDPSKLSFVTRAITPPGFPRRFDARFFCVDVGAVVHRTPGVVHADAELVELCWLPISEAIRLDLPVITGFVLEELQMRFRSSTGYAPVPFYHPVDDDFVRDLID